MGWAWWVAAVAVVLLALGLSFAPVISGAQPAGAFSKSYALVIGIDKYKSKQHWSRLNYAANDAAGIARFLRHQQFDVVELRDEQATKQAIESAIGDLVSKVTSRDRVLFFFAGHGTQRTIGGEEFGFLVPADATDAVASLYPTMQLHAASRFLGAARHQLFILDSCFGGLAGRRAQPETTILAPNVIDFMQQATQRRARQLMTAGGPDQRVADDGPDGYSRFTGELLGALSQGLADKNGDGFVTFTELFMYLQVAASTFHQTPGIDFMDGHQQGEFVFSVPNRRPVAESSNTPAATDALLLIEGGIELLQTGRLEVARKLFSQAADSGHAVAMRYVGKLIFKGQGGPRDLELGVSWLRKAAAKGDTVAMLELANFLEESTAMRDLSESKRWRVAHAEATRAGAKFTFVDTDGKPKAPEPELPNSNDATDPIMVLVAPIAA
jgi:uncharacterized caspase-like protein